MCKKTRKLNIRFILLLTEPCWNYQSLNDTSRSISASVQEIYRSDGELINRWYRFNGGKHSQMIATTCIKSYGKCGALLPGWMPRKHPMGD